jgi:hypothetical protein
LAIAELFPKPKQRIEFMTSEEWETVVFPAFMKFPDYWRAKSKWYTHSVSSLELTDEDRAFIAAINGPHWVTIIKIWKVRHGVEL